MPSYEVYHSHPLTPSQRQALATSITNLHCTAFTTPSFFVHVQFISHDASDGTYFMAGKARLANSNHIKGHVRTSAARSRADFDDLGAKIESAWYDVLRVPGGPEPADDETKRLLKMSFHPMIAIREVGMAIPEAGKEGEWFKRQMPFFEEMAERKGNQDFVDLLRELAEREDLKRLLQ